MDEFISKSAFLEKMSETPRYFNIKYDVLNFPPADVEPVRHGHWAETVVHGEVPDYDCVCSLCGKSGLPIYNFCPNCGAKMDEEEL